MRPSVERSLAVRSRRNRPPLTIGSAHPGRTVYDRQHASRCRRRAETTLPVAAPGRTAISLEPRLLLERAHALAVVGVSLACFESSYSNEPSAPRVSFFS